MKKFFSLLLAAVMLLTACAALAEANTQVLDFDDSFNVSVVVPEGYELASEVDQGVLLARVVGGEDQLGMLMLIAGNADFEENTINEMSEEQKQAYVDSLMEDSDSEPWSIRTTGMGTELVLIEAEEDAIDVVYAALIYHGYDIIVSACYADGRTLTEDDNAFVLQFITDMNFEAVAPAAQ